MVPTKAEVIHSDQGLSVTRQGSVLMEVSWTLLLSCLITHVVSLVSVSWSEYKAASEMELVPKRVHEGTLGA